jgi:phosphoribosylformylglycinamidine synthase
MDVRMTPTHEPAPQNAMASQDQRWTIRVRPASPRLDSHGRDVLGDVRRAGFHHVEAVHSGKVYLLEGRVPRTLVAAMAEQLLADRVTEEFTFEFGLSHREDAHPAVEVHPQPGVMNPPALSALSALRRWLRLCPESDACLERLQVARRYEIIGARDAVELERIAAKVLANGCIENWYVQGLGRIDELPDRFPTPPERPFVLRRIALHALDDDGLRKLSRDGHLFLSLEEMKTIRDHFGRLGRDPTDLELETFAQTWSEHCVHKTLKSTIVYQGEDFGRPGHVEVRFDNLLKRTIVAATQSLARDWCLSVFVDNAGIVAFDEEFGLAFKVETHNHPSAIEPYGGAATGVGGCIRDVMGCGLGARPIASTDVFCLAPPNFPEAQLPKDVLHPRRVLKGVVSGVRDYGNRMGIPTVNGAIYFDRRFLANPLVFCGCVGLIRRDRIFKKANSGDHIVVAGGRTGRDGIHGATFSSAELTDDHADEFAHAVQIGNAIEEKKLLDAQLIARDHPQGCLYSCVTDCGAGGLSSAVGEMAAELGAVVELDQVPLKYEGLRYDEIWISEAQERMVFAVPPDRLDAFLSVFADEDVEASVIGTFTNDRVLRVRYRGETVGELELRFLHEGLPQSVRVARWSPAEASVSTRTHVESRPEHQQTSVSETRHGQFKHGNQQLLSSLAELNITSKEWVIRQYDHEVQGRSVIKPLVGPGFGPSDAAVLRPRLDGYRGVALGCGLCPHRTERDPYWMAIAAVDEALRNVICVGADPLRTAILDNFCWPKTDSPGALGELVRACRGAADAAVAYGLPFISGKDSLNNEFAMSEEESRRTGLPARLAIPGTLLISALGQVGDVRRCVSMDLKEPGNALVLAAAPVDRVGLVAACALHRKVADLVAGGTVRAAHDVSDGGLATAVAEMCIASRLGARVELSADLAVDGLADVPTTYVLEMSESSARSCGFPIVGRVDAIPRLSFRGNDGDFIDLAVSELTDAWRGSLGQP